MEFVKWENTLDSREKEKKVFFWRKGKCASYFDRFFFNPYTHNIRRRRRRFGSLHLPLYEGETKSSSDVIIIRIFLDKEFGY